LVPKRYQWIVLLLSSLVFFCLVGTWWTLIYLILSVIVTYVAGIMISRYNEHIEKSEIVSENLIKCEEVEALKEETKIKTKAVSRKKMKIWFIVALTINLTLLALLKYANFALNNAGKLYGIFTKQRVNWKVSWVASLGISFYTLQIVGYLLDCYWGIAKPQKNIFKFALFSCFFPQMVSGPISRYSQLGQELEQEHKFNWSNIRAGSIRIIVGFFKKLVVANNIAQFSSMLIYETYGLFALLGMLAYVVQIYADFAGCMDIVLGSAKCLGINMVENFKSPFRSLTIQEFWRNWHITLGLWLKDYVMYPILRSKTFIKLTKKIKGKFGKRCAKLIPTHIAMLILWFCMGLWHGGGWNFILEGFWFWGIIVAGEWMSPLFKKVTKNFKDENFLWVWFRRLRTIAIYAIGAMMFMASGIADFIVIMTRIFSPSAILTSVRSFSFYLSKIISEDIFGYVFFAIAGFIVMLAISVIEFKSGGLAKKLERKPFFLQCLVLFMLITLIIFFGLYGSGYNSADFIYGGF